MLKFIRANKPQRSITYFATPAAFALVLLFSSTLLAQSTVGNAEMRFRDGLKTIVTAWTPVLSGPSTHQPAITHAKVILSNSSTSSRSVDCRLQYPNLSVDISSVTLQPNSFATLSLQVAKGATATSVQASLSCLVTTGNSAGVNAQFAKITALAVNSVGIFSGS